MNYSPSQVDMKWMAKNISGSHRQVEMVVFAVAKRYTDSLILVEDKWLGMDSNFERMACGVEKVEDHYALRTDSAAHERDLRDS